MVILLFVLAVTIAVSFMNVVGWPGYAMRWRQRIENALFRRADHARARRQPDTTKVKEEPDALVLMRTNSLDEELLRLIAERKEAPYDPARPRDETDAPSTLEFCRVSPQTRSV